LTEEIRKKGACRALIAIPIELETAATQYAIEQFDVASRKDVVGFGSCGGSDDGGIFALWPCFTYFGQANNRS
jgi:hypothetical protein